MQALVRPFICCTLLTCVLFFTSANVIYGADSRLENRRIFARQLNDITFRDSQTGFAVGGNGVIFRTVNGGMDWAKQQLVQNSLVRITFQDKQHGWIVTENGKLLNTQDGGKSWLPLSRPTNIQALQFLLTAGLAVGNNGMIAVTANGGNTWEQRSSGVRTNLRDIACFSRTACIVVGDKRTILSTSDGGETWSERYPPIGELDIRRIKQSQDGIAWLVGVGYKFGTVLFSKDQGRQWAVVSESLPTYPTSLFFFNAHRGVIAETGLFLTEDGGNTWASVWPGGPLLKEVFFLNEKLGWAVGDYKTILHSTD